MNKTASSLIIFLIALCGVALAETVTTTDGRTIKLNPDGTYEFLDQKPKISFQVVDLDKLSVEGENWIEKNVAVQGYLKVSGTRGDFGSISKTLSRTSSIRADLELIPISQKRRLLDLCKLQCQVSLKGVFQRHGSFDFRIKVANVELP